MGKAIESFDISNRLSHFARFPNHWKWSTLGLAVESTTAVSGMLPYAMLPLNFSSNWATSGGRECLQKMVLAFMWQGTGESGIWVQDAPSGGVRAFEGL